MALRVHRVRALRPSSRLTPTRTWRHTDGEEQVRDAPWRKWDGVEGGRASGGQVSQLDAARLDTELLQLIRDQLLTVFSGFSSGSALVASAELECLGELLLFAGTLGRGAPTPGAALLNLRYRDERGPGRGGRTGLEGRGLSTAQRVQLVALTVVGKYVWARLGNHVAVSRWSQHAPTSWRRGAWRMLHTVDAGYNVASVVHFLHFLRHGVYRTLPERLVGARLVYGHTPFSQPTCFEHMNRELVWHELSELLLFVLPLLSAARLIYWARRVGSLLFPQSQGGSKPTVSPHLCAACGNAPKIPFVAQPCGHRYCYYCLRARCMNDPRFKCVFPTCSAQVISMHRHLQLASQKPA